MQHEGFISLLDDDDDDDDDDDEDEDDDDNDDDDIDDDEYWEKKFTHINYKRYIEMSDKAFGPTLQKWFSVSKPTCGICSVQPAHLLRKDPGYLETLETVPLSESSFSLVKKLGNYRYFVFGTTLQSVMFSPQYTYACYLLLKLRDNHSVPGNTLLFRTECELDGISMGGMISYLSMYPMNIPTIMLEWIMDETLIKIYLKAEED
ncbi:hypothetical protein Tco_0222403 [Tanacetum coccineum]